MQIVINDKFFELLHIKETASETEIAYALRQYYREHNGDMSELGLDIIVNEPKLCFDLPEEKDFIVSSYPFERTEVEVRKDLKYEKNPMRIRQLNRELNDILRYRKRGY
jgi:hypothetical protein